METINARIYTEADEIYKSLYGYYPVKNGTALEVLSTAAYEIATHSSESVLNINTHGESGAREQIDGRLIVCDESVMLEAKDRGHKIGIGLVRDFEGALIDFPYARGVMAAKEYTKDAKLYAKGTAKNKRAIRIDLLVVRGSKKEDLEGRITGFKIKTSVPPIPLSGEANWYFLLSHDTIDKINRSGISIKDENKILIVDSSGENVLMVPLFMEDAKRIISTNNLGNGDIVKGQIDGMGYFAQLSDGNKYPIEQFNYSVPVFAYESESEIKPDGNPVFYILSEEEGINKLITDTQLLEYGKRHGLVKD